MVARHAPPRASALDSVPIAVDRFKIPGLSREVELCRAADIEPLATQFLQRLPSRSSDDPGFYGAVLWPAALLLAQLLACGPPLSGKSCLELGAGTGLGSLVAAHRGACAVATDVYPLSLELIQTSADMSDPPLNVSVQHFDLCSPEPLPSEVDIVIAADVLYLTDLTKAVARRIAEACKQGSSVLLTDSRGTHREELIRELDALGVHGARFQEHNLDWLPQPHDERASVLLIEQSLELLEFADGACSDVSA
ncbi:MAG: hypothetical protein SGPRY_005350 [Prymnesium sp.]